MPRFVVLQHDHPESLHWDFLLEFDDRMLTWALPLPPCYDHPLPARALPDHRKEYLQYEGPVSQGRGTVVRWDRGTFECLVRDEDRVEVDLRGAKLVGRLCIERSSQSPEEWQWHLTSAILRRVSQRGPT